MEQSNQQNVFSLVKKPFYLLSIILLITIFSFFGSVHNDFIPNWDDNGYIIHNDLIKDLSFSAIRKMFMTFYVGNYHPLTALSNSIEYKLFGLNPSAYHFFNLVFHLCNVILVFYFIFLLTQRVETSAIVAVFFAVHPMHVESVAWISERKDVLYSFFYLGALIVYLRNINYSTYLKERGWEFLFVGGRFRMRLSFFLFLLACLSKSSAVSLPLILLLIDYYQGKKLNWNNFKEKIPFFIVSLTFGIINIFSQKSSGTMDLYHPFSLADRIFFPFYAICFYLFKIAIPTQLSVIYFFPEKINGFLPVQYYLSPFIVILIIFFVAKARQFRKQLFFGSLFFLFTIFLTLQILSFGNAIVADRYSYLPYIGLFFIMGEFYCKISDGVFLFPAFTKPIFTLILIAVIFCFSIMTFNRNKIWKDAVTLSSDVIQKYPLSIDAYLARGVAKENVNDIDGAIADYNIVLNINNRVPEAYNKRGVASTKLKDYKGAYNDFTLAIRFQPGMYLAYNNRGIVKTYLGDFQGALDDFSESVRIKNDYVEAIINRGNTSAYLKNYDEAIRDLTTALKIKPNLPEVYYNRAMVKFQSGNNPGACEDWKMASGWKLQKADEMFQRYCK